MDEQKCAEYETIRKYVRKQKEEAANEETRHDTKYGDYCGYTLKPPYTLEEIETFEVQIESRLPEKLREYLLYVSREFIGYNNCNCIICDNILEFKLDPKKVKECNIPEGEDTWEDDYPSIQNGFVPFLPESHAAYYYIVLKGNNYGSEWYWNQEFEQTAYREKESESYFDTLKNKSQL